MNLNNSQQHSKLKAHASGRLINDLAALLCFVALLIAVQLVSGQHHHKGANNESPPPTQQQADLEQNNNNRQRHPVVSSLLGSEHNEQQNGGGNGNSPTSINLIPVDQPVRESKSAEDSPPSSLAEPRIQSAGNQLLQQAGNGFEPAEPIAFAAGDQEDTNIEAQYEAGPAADAQNEIRQGQFHHMQQQLEYGHPTASGVERRFGLFKSKLGAFGHYGAPQMSANYAYLSDACERCLASMSQQQPQSADLQDSPPPPPIQPLPQPLPVPVPMPINQPSYSYQQPQPQQHQHPLKSKLFMKFPFFMKPSMFGGGGGLGDYGGGHSVPPSYPSSLHSLPLLSNDYGNSAANYWPAQANQQQQQQLYQPTRAPAIYLRPASAYNCIQTQPPLYASASNNLQQQLEQQINISPSISQQQSKTAKSPAAPIKQQQQVFQQQTSY